MSRPDSIIEMLLTSALRIPPTVAMAQYVGSITADHHAALAKMNRPTLLVCTDETERAMESMRAAIPGSQLAYFPKAGHALFIDQADHFNTVLQAFLARVYAGRRTSTRPSPRID